MNTKSLIKWNQKTIRDWSEATFGPCHPGQIARRMEKEVQELLELFQKIGDQSVDELIPEQVQELQLECADIAIFLDQIAEDLGADLVAAKNFKMEVNCQRRWAFNEDRQQTRHVTEFREEGSQFIFQLDKWYIYLLDGWQCGEGHKPVGFDTAQQALLWAEAEAQRSGLVRSWPLTAGIPRWVAEASDWEEPAYSFNVLFGRDLYDFQVHSNKLFHPGMARGEG